MGALAEGPRPASSERISLTGVDGVTVPAVLARPTDGDAADGLVAHPDLFGLRPLFDDLCRRLATHGYAVCCPEPFARASAAVRDATDAAARLETLPTLDDDRQLGDLAAAADRLATPTVSVLGFCMGGMQTLKAAARPAASGGRARSTG